MDRSITVNASAVSPVALTLMRYALTALGTVMVSRGVLDQGDADSIVGALLIIIPTIWGAYISKRNNAQKVAMAEVLPDSIAQVKGAQ